MPNILSSCWNTFREYVVFPKFLLYITGLICCLKFMERKFLNTLITRLTADLGKDQYDLRGVVNVVCWLEAATGVAALFFAKAADVYDCRILIVYLSALAWILGLILDYLAGNDDNGQLNWVFFYWALVLVGLAVAAQRATLEEFLNDQFQEVPVRQAVEDAEAPVHEGAEAPPLNQMQRWELRRQYSKVWWTLVSFVAAIVAQVWSVSVHHTRKLEPVLILVVAFFTLMFFLGGRYIRHRAIEQNDQRHMLAMNHKWLWPFLIILSPVYACGSTFFVLEANRLADHDDISAILLISNVARVTAVFVSETSSYQIRKLRDRYNRGKMELLRIGIGMCFCMLCCIIAGVTATHRRYHTGNTMKVYWLIPQYVFLGVMSGFAEDGFQALYESQDPDGASRYGQPIKEAARGIGYCMGIVFVFIFRREPFEIFRKHLEISSLSDYYALLAGLNVLSFMIYFCVVFWYNGLPFFLVQGGGAPPPPQPPAQGGGAPQPPAQGGGSPPPPQSPASPVPPQPPAQGGDNASLSSPADIDARETGYFDYAPYSATQLEQVTVQPSECVYPQPAARDGEEEIDSEQVTGRWQQSVHRRPAAHTEEGGSAEGNRGEEEFSNDVIKQKIA